MPYLLAQNRSEYRPGFQLSAVPRPDFQQIVLSLRYYLENSNDRIGIWSAAHCLPQQIQTCCVLSAYNPRRVPVHTAGNRGPASPKPVLLHSGCRRSQGFPLTMNTPDAPHSNCPNKNRRFFRTITLLLIQRKKAAIWSCLWAQIPNRNF